MPKLRSDDGSERQTENSDGSERQNWKAMMALNAKTKLKIVMALNTDSEQRWWLWTPRLEMSMALNTDTEQRWWLWTSRLEMSMALNVDWEVMTTLNAKTENSDGYECQNWEVMMTLNTKLKIVMALNAKTKIVMALNADTEQRWWLWTSKPRSDDDDSERQAEKRLRMSIWKHAWVYIRLPTTNT